MESETQAWSNSDGFCGYPQAVLSTPQKLTALLGFALLVLVISVPRFMLKCKRALGQLRILLRSKSPGVAQNPAPRSLLAFLVWTVWFYLMPCAQMPFLTPALAEDTQWVGAGPCLEQRRMGLQGASFQTGKTQGP